MEIIKKFNWRWLMMLAAVMMMGVTMTACGDDDDDDDDVVAGSLVGVWVDPNDLVVDGEDEVYATKLNADGTGASGIWTIHSKTFTVPEYDPEHEFGYFEWSFSDGVLTLSGDIEAGSAEVEMSDDGKSMRLIAYDEEYDEYYSVYLVRVR